MSFRFSHFITVKIWCTRVVQLSISNFKWYTYKMIRLQVITVFFKFLFFTFWNIFFGFRFSPQFFVLSYFRCHGSAHTIVGFPLLRESIRLLCIIMCEYSPECLTFQMKNTKLVFMLLTFGCCTIEFLAFQNDKTTEYIFYRVM